MSILPLTQPPAPRPENDPPSYLPAGDGVLVTPDLAERLLADCNRQNRRPVMSRVKRYADDMAAGRWTRNGDRLRFSLDGRLLDGQHRLLACVRSGMPFRTDVVKGLPDEVFTTIDQGMKRSATQLLDMSGEKRPLDLGAAASLHHQYHSRAFSHAGRNSDAVIKSHRVVEYVAQHPQLRESVATVLPYKRKYDRLLPRSVACCLHALAAEAGKLDEAFFEALANGAGLAAGNPALVLRETLRREGDGPRRLNRTLASLTGGHQGTVLKFAVAIKGYVAWVQGRQVSVLRWPVSEEFPYLL